VKLYRPGNPAETYSAGDMAEFSQKRAIARHDEHASERVVSGAPLDEDARLDASVRPKTLAEYIGQKRVKENISIAIEAARTRGEALDHVLLYGPPGLGKTTLAQIIANELGVVIKTSAGPLLERKGDLTAILTSLEKKEVFFLDEIHRLQPAVEEVLYPAMEDFRVDLVIGQGPGARIHPFHLSQFTLIGATTRAGLITAPLRSRFGIVHRLDFYEPEDLLIILRRSAKILNIQMEPVPRKLPAVAAARRALPTVCCAAPAISPKCAPLDASPAKWPRNRYACWAWMSMASTKWIVT
jgi:Holliday junction resolvasome RuvABC ATP-dependent DNA helicase subunit